MLHLRCFFSHLNSKIIEKVVFWLRKCYVMQGFWYISQTFSWNGIISKVRGIIESGNVGKLSYLCIRR